MDESHDEVVVSTQVQENIVIDHGKYNPDMIHDWILKLKYGTL